MTHNFDKYINKIVEVEWKDAVGEQKKLKEELNNIPPSQLLVETNTYGVLYKIDEEAILILSENSDDEVDYTAIPISCVMKIKEMKGVNKKKK